MGWLFKHRSSQGRLALTIRLILYAQLLTVWYQCVLGVFEVNRSEVIRKFGHEGYLSISHNLFSIRHAVPWYFDLAAVGFTIAILVCLLHGVLVLHIPRKQAYLYTALGYLSLVLGILQGIGESLTWRE
jgi:hypothetical protein